MLYSVPIKLKNKDYSIKIGMQQLIDLQKSGISIEQASEDIELSFQFLHKCIANIDMTIEELIEAFDNSEMAWFELQEKIVEAYELGVNKGKKPKEVETQEK